MTLILRKVTKEQIATMTSALMKERVMELLKDLPGDAEITAQDVLNFRNMSPRDKWMLAADSLFVGSEASNKLFGMLQEKWIENCRQRDEYCVNLKENRRQQAKEIKNVNMDKMARDDMKLMLTLLSALTDDYKRDKQVMKQRSEDEVKYETLREFMFSDAVS